MTRLTAILIGMSLFSTTVLVAAAPAIHLDLRFTGCSPEAQVFSVRFPGGGQEDATFQSEGRWRITLRNDAVDPKATRLEPEIEGFWIQPATGRSVGGVGHYIFKCTRLKTVLVQSEPFDPPLPFHYRITKPKAEGPANTEDCTLLIHPGGGISISLQEGTCQYNLPPVYVSSLTGKSDRTAIFDLMQYWSQYCASKGARVSGLDMGTAAAQLARGLAEETAGTRPQHDVLRLYLDEPPNE
jgi:hypothetical protein